MIILGKRKPQLNKSILFSSFHSSLSPSQCSKKHHNYLLKANLSLGLNYSASQSCEILTPPPSNIILLVSMRTHGQAGGCSRSEGFEVRHNTPSLPTLWLQPATLSSWASFLSSVKKNGMCSEPEDCDEYIVESSWFTVGPHSTLVFVSSSSPFTNEELRGSGSKRDSPEVTQLVDPLSRPKPTSLYPRFPVPWIFTQPHILWAKNKSKMSLGKQDYSSCLPREFCTREFSGLLQCADVLPVRTCLSRFHSFSSPLGQPVFIKIGQGGGWGGGVTTIFIIVYLAQTWIGFFGRKTCSEDRQGSWR